MAHACFLPWAALGAAACSDDGHEPANAETSSASGAGASGGTGAGPGGTGGGGDGGGAASSGAGGSGGGGGDGGGAASAGAGGSGGEGSHGLTCRDSIFPGFSKACEQASDCVVLEHITSCCGDVLFVGVDAEDKGAFESAEAACAASYPLCDCPTGPPVAEDGKPLDNPSEAAVVARCKEGSCTSEIRYLP
ncbi:hypothetical protein [Sorangium sp. So ce887]|uniref:hypothetical protein n=1 Tax=Sorangium sp. So ce887 TaxID=3133324 RepID=UPI003F5E1ABA